MRTIVFAFIAACSMSAPVHAEILPATAAYLRQIGINPAAREVVTVANDRVNNASLNSLAAAKDEKGLRTFIGTRNVVHEARAKPKGPINVPKPEVYDAMKYMTSDERQVVGKAFLEQLMGDSGGKSK